MVILKTKPLVEEAVTDLYCKSLPTKCLTIADLGCSSGPNSLLVISEIIEAIDTKCQKLGQRSPEFHVFLNDLPGNDFNSIFKTIPSFPEKLKNDKGDEFGPCFIAGTPGSFYGRLFPANTINFVHSSYSLHYLSQFPPGIENNKEHIYIAATSPPSVRQAYFAQFQRDFKVFLKSRSEEITAGGHMVITMIGRRNSDSFSEECWDAWEMLAQSLCEIITEGHIEAAKLDSFNLPWYAPSPDEVRAAVEEEKSFHLNLVEIMDGSKTKDIVHDKLNNGAAMARFMRAVTESMFVSHFGEKIVKNLFDKYAVHVDDCLKQTSAYVNLVMTMTKKG